MLLEVLSISTKTPRDGKVEITRASHEKLAALGTEFRALAPAGPGRARLTSIRCTCAKRAGEQHVHYFVECDLFKQLTPGASVCLDIDEDAMSVRLAPV